MHARRVLEALLVAFGLSVASATATVSRWWRTTATLHCRHPADHQGTVMPSVHIIPAPPNRIISPQNRL